MAISLTGELNELFETSNDVSFVPSVFKRITLFADNQLYVLKFPQAKILPSLCNVIV
jgi:hypothetical protein